MKKKVLFEEFEKITDELLVIDLSENTDMIINLVENKLKKRDEIIKNIEKCDDKNNISDEDLMKIIQKNNQVETVLSEIKLNVSTAISKTVFEKSLSSKKKKAHRGYMNIGKQTDGYFIDNKK